MYKIKNEDTRRRQPCSVFVIAYFEHILHHVTLFLFLILSR